ncbi:guanylyl cyclase [Trifolium pratense]|uniref:Guanylyl cyclase n=1 Tax=Trifolium pratense TaxID=57577 RepID=A0A2K3P9Q0_TRIPR|nr:guanylyl cyclase [Trifolium pratense]
MWPICLLFNKILKTEDERELKGENLSAIETYLLQHSSCNIDSHPPSLRRSLFIDISLVFLAPYTTSAIKANGRVATSMKRASMAQFGGELLALGIWTVDLAYLLQRFSVAFSYFTVTFGANPNYCGESFYKEELPNDLARVDMLFQDAVEAGIDIQCRSISEEEISFLILSGKYIAIALVDHNKLSHAWQDFHVPGVLSSNSEYTGEH